jgi:hypothetical protein
MIAVSHRRIGMLNRQVGRIAAGPASEIEHFALACRLQIRAGWLASPWVSV